MLDRIKNPLFLAASISFLYNITNYVTTAFFHTTIDPNTWLTFFNLLLWLVLGVGVYSNYTPSQSTSQQPIQYQSPIATSPTIAPVTSAVPPASIPITPPVEAPTVPPESSPTVDQSIINP